MAENVMSVTDGNFEDEILKAELPALVDFWASWCVPCRMIAPTVEGLAETYKDKLKVAKMNVDENVKTPAKFGIRGIPSLLLFKGGELKEMIVGVQPKDKIAAIIAKHL